jgi:hypothetical protein
MKNSDEIKNYVRRSLYVFHRHNISLIALMNICFIAFSQSKGLTFNLGTLLLLNLLTLFYVVSSQIRDLLLRFHKNKIYGIDFVLQFSLSMVVLVFLIYDRLTVTIFLQIFAFSYGVYAAIIILVLQRKDRSFRAVFVIRKSHPSLGRDSNFGKRDLFSKTGILFQFALSKDLLLGLFVLTKEDFGLMSALASFWVVARFLGPTAVIQNKISEGDPRSSGKSHLTLRFFNKNKVSTIQVQAIVIGILGLSGYLFIPMLMGSGFQPSSNMAIAGIGAEVLLMKTLYDLSTSELGFSQNLFVFTSFLQVMILGVMHALGAELSIALVWSTSALTYLLWQVLIFSKKKYEKS